VRLHPTKPTFHVAAAGVVIVLVGVLIGFPGFVARGGAAAVVSFGGAMLLAIAAGRALALGAVTRLRTAGFEMVWSTPKRVARTAAGGTIELEAELRNRGIDDVRGVALRVLSSSYIEAEVEPKIVDLPPESRAFVKVTLRAKRVGRWGVHGMALEVRGTELGGEGLYEVPLMFANPFGVEVLPVAMKMMLDSPVGGRARRGVEAGRPTNLVGEGDSLKELRDHVPGDSFKRIAWKASARRGKLVVREMERDQRDVVWLVLDASVELWAGEPGHAPLDHAVEEVASAAARHLTKGDRVGLVVTASRLRTWLSPEAGPSQASRIAAALASAASTVDADRSDLDEAEVAGRVAEHARPLDPRGLSDIGRGDLDMLAARAEILRTRAPFAPRLSFGASARERTLRHYLASFGIECPPRSEGERDKTVVALAQALDRMMREKARPSTVYVWSPAPEEGTMLAQSVRKLRARHVEVRWVQPAIDLEDDAASADPVKVAVYDVVRMRSEVAEERGGRALRKLGARPSTMRRITSHGEPVPAPTAAHLLADPNEPIPPSGEAPPSGEGRPPQSEEPARGQR
jgi:uncharacterized protein (DUF58 family)